MYRHFPYLLLVLPFALTLTPFSYSSDATWMEVKSPHFSVITDAGEKRGREVAIRFEQMRAVYANLLTKSNVNLPIPLQIVAFRNTKEFRQVAPLWNGKPVQLAGLFQGGSDRCFIMLDMSTEDPWKVVFHEYAHQLMNGTLSTQLDPWFQEGFAEYFSSIEVDSHQARVGKIPDQTYQIVRQDGMMKITDLFRVQHDSSTYNESNNRRTVFYAESSMVVHYIYDNNLMLKLAAYFDARYNKSASVEDAIQQAFGMSAADFEKAIRSYVARGQYKYWYMKTPPEIETKGYATRALTSTDAAAAVADIHAHSRDYRDQAVGELEEVLKSDPNNAAASRGMGFVYLQHHKLDEAREFFQRAAKADPKDPRVHYYSGLLMNLHGVMGQSDSSAVVEELKQAVALDPNFADAYIQLAYAQQRAGDNAGAMASAKKALELNPSNVTYYFTIADMYLHAGKIEDGLGLYRALTKSSDPAVAARASEGVSRIERMQAAIKEAATRPPMALASADAPSGPPESGTGSPAGSRPASAVKFLKGTIVKVDCTSSPGATLTLSSAGNTWSMQVRDTHYVLVMGTDGFSCGWSKQKAALNFRETSEFAGTVVSIEIQ
ncbi:MAG: tetratricopeptide repeat protein [Anaerolineae bacterium]